MSAVIFIQRYALGLYIFATFYYSKNRLILIIIIAVYIAQ